MRFGYLLHGEQWTLRQACIAAVLSEHLVLAYIKYGFDEASDYNLDLSPFWLGQRWRSKD